MNWKVQYIGNKPKLNNPILIEGLPGIGNVGKIALDFILEELKAKKIAEFRGNSIPHSVFINEDNLVDLPSIELYYKKMKQKDLLLLAGDVQPNDEPSCYEFCDAVLDTMQEFNCNEIITLGGIALRQEPKMPQVFVTGSSKEIVDSYAKGTKANKKIYGKVGPIIGVTGVLLGLAKRRNIQAVSLLAETFGHPYYLGVSGAREILKVLKKKLQIDLDINVLDKEIAEIEQELGKTQELLRHYKKKDEVNYIG
ncbi:PAC2 family protein [uncultured archaeon]|nr:PAC2 family protein [uncultured archaeon]